MGTGLTMIGRVFATAAIATAMIMGAAASANAEAKKAEKKDELSDRAVKLLMGMAFTGMPLEMKTKDGKTVKIDKSKPEDIMVPIPDGRRVIMVGRRSAYAQACDLPKLQVANYKAFMHSEHKTKKWSRVQMIYINRLHLFTLALMTGQLEATPDKEGDEAAKKGDKTAKADKSEAETVKSKIGKLTCPPERKEEVRKQIESFVEEVKKTAS